MRRADNIRTDKVVFNKGVNFLSILYKTIAIKNFIFQSKIFTYEQVTVQNLHEKWKDGDFLKDKRKGCNSSQVSVENTDRLPGLARGWSHVGHMSQVVYSHKSAIHRQFNTITSENRKNQLVYLS